MLKRRQKVSHVRKYHQPSFWRWIRYTGQAKMTLGLVFLLTFGSLGYITLSYTSAASQINVTSLASNGTRPPVTFAINVQQPSGAYLSYGTRTTPVTLGNDGNAQLTFQSTTSGYTMNFWQFSDGTRVNGNTIVYAPKSHTGQTLTINLNAPPDPAPTVSLSASATSVTQNGSLTLNWSSTNASSCTASGTWSGGKAVNGSENRSADAKTTGTKQYTLTCSGSGGSANKTVSVNVTAPARSGSTGSGGSSGSSGTTSRSSGGSAATPPSTTAAPPPVVPTDGTDTTPPDAPTQFFAAADESTGLVQLGWLPGNDNIGIDHYVLERSMDQNTWEVVSDKVSGSAYVDSGVAYETQYYYRLKAVDGNNNASGYATTDVVTPKFKANITSGEGGSFGTQDNWMTVKVPPGAVDTDTQCAIKDDTALPPEAKGYLLFAGPYKLICKTQKGDVLLGFNKEVLVTFRLDKAVQNQYNDRRFYTGNDGKWSHVKAQTKGDTVTFSLKDQLQIAALGKKKSTPLIVKILLVLLLIGLIAGAVVGLLYWRYKRQQDSQYEDYLRQQYGL